MRRPSRSKSESVILEFDMTQPEYYFFFSIKTYEKIICYWKQRTSYHATTYVHVSNTCLQLNI